ncbi:MAG: hypothetical protein JXB20_04780 [Bacilli bacterium]|nr:hypothetical protein [Bacilli bacterium]MBN2696191.1 hypothetical protein [Bacilli bacterium]
MNAQFDSAKSMVKKTVQSLSRLIRNIWSKIHESALGQPRQFSALLVTGSALSQLALSQIHIEALIRVKLTVATEGASNYTAGMPSTGIGMFNFLFILFGLVSIFNVLRATTRRKMLVGLVSLIIAAGFGIIYLLQLTNPDNIVDYIDIVKSVNLVKAAFTVNGIAAAIIIYGMITFGKRERVR